MSTLWISFHTIILYHRFFFPVGCFFFPSSLLNISDCFLSTTIADIDIGRIELISVNCPMMNEQLPNCPMDFLMFGPNETGRNSAQKIFDEYQRPQMRENNNQHCYSQSHTKHTIGCRLFLKDPRSVDHCKHTKRCKIILYNTCTFHNGCD